MSVNVPGFKSSSVFEAMKNVNPDVANDISAVYEFVLSSNNNKQSWTVDLKSSPPTITVGKPSGKADCVIITTDENFVGIMDGSIDATELFMGGNLKIKGDMSLAMKLSSLKGTPAATPSATGSSTTSKGKENGAATESDSLRVKGFVSSNFFVELSKSLKEHPEIVEEVGAVYEFALTNEAGEKQSWTVDIKNGKGSVKAGKGKEKPDCMLILSDENFNNLMEGKADGTELYLSGGMKIKGDMSLAMKLDALKGKTNKSKL